MSKKIEELKKTLNEVKAALQKEEHKVKKREGVLKEGEWLKVDVFEYDCNDDLKLSEGDPIILYHSCQGVQCLNAYIDIPSEYIAEILDEATSFEVWKAKKISKEEAIKYL